VPLAYNVNNMRAIVLLIDTISNEIKNSNGAPLIAGTGLPETANAVNSFNVFPNPFADEASLVFRLAKPENVSVRISTLVGETITNYEAGTMPSGEHTMSLNGKNLPAGMYLVTLKAGTGSVIKKVMLSK